MKSISEIAGMSNPGANLEYQDLIRSSVWQAILLATRDPITHRRRLRDEDIIFALLDLQALIAASSGSLTSNFKVHQFSERIAKRIQARTGEALKAQREHGGIAELRHTNPYRGRSDIE